MKFNALYLFWVVAFAACFWLKDHFMGRSNSTFFGATETESRSINYDHTVVIQQILVKTGDKVQAGDTLMFFSRAELDQESAEKLSEILENEVEKNAQTSILDKSLQVLKAEHQAKTNEMLAQIKLEQTEYNAESSVRKLLGEDQTSASIDPLRAEKIAALRSQITQAEVEYQEKVKKIQAERKANLSVAAARKARTQVELDFVKTEKQRLILLAPVDGFVESIAVGNTEVVPQHKELLKINPLKPTRIRGFIYEHSDIPYQLGDTVLLSAYNRQGIQTEGVIIGSNPQVVELPVRLRKVPEMRTWGREIFVKIPENNPFYLNEKIAISFQ